MLKNKITRAYSTSILGLFSGLLTNLWLLREITQVVPVNDFGMYALVLQISAYFAILQLGLDFAASRQIAESLGRSKPQEANESFYQLRRFNHKLVLLALLGVLTISSLLWSGLLLRSSIDAEFARLAASVALVAGIAQVISFLARPFSAALIGSLFQPTVNLLAVARTMATTVLAFVFLKSGFYVLAVPAAEVITQLLNWIALRTIAHRKCSWRTAPNETKEKSRLLRSMLKFGGLSALGGLAWTLESGMDLVLLGILTDSKVVAAYLLWWRFPQMLFDLCARLAWSAFPRFAGSFGESHAAARLLLTKVAYLTLGLGSLSLIGISLWLRPFMDLWIGTDYLEEQSIYLALAMGLLVCMRTFGNLLAMFWMSSGQAGFSTAMAWLQATTKIILACLLVPQFGIIGLIIASCLASSIQLGAMLWLLGQKRLIGLDLVARAFAVTLLAILLSIHVVHYSISVGWAGLVWGAIATACGWAAICLLAALTGELRQPILTYLRSCSSSMIRFKI